MSEVLVDLERDGEAAEIILGKPPRFVHFSIVLIVALILTGIIWAYFSKIDIVITAPGSVRPQGDLIKLQPIVSGRLSEVLVKEGQTVKVGDILFRLDSKENEAELEKARNSRERAALSLSEARVQEEAAQKDWQRTQDLMEAGVLSHVELERKEIAKRIAEASLHSAEAALRIAEEEERKLGNSLTYLEITAPVSGTVTSLMSRNAGEVVTAGSVLATLAPENAPWIVEAFVSNKDAGALRQRTGDRVKLKFDAYSFRDYGLGEGKLLSVAPDASADPKLGLAYRVEVGIESLTLKRGHREGQIQLGMSVQAEIVKEEERMLFMLFKDMRDRLALD